MSTINELIYNVRMEIKDFKSDDIKLSDRNIEFLINFLRVKLIRQDVDKNKSVSPNYEQSLGVIELENVDKSEDDDFPTGTSILRSVKEIPTPVDVKGDELITSIRGLDGGNRIDFKPEVQAIKNLWTKYASKRLVAYYSGNRLYIVNCLNELENITVTGVFENPREVANFKRKDGEPCYNPDKDRYPISSHLIDMINTLIKRQELDLYFQLIEDKINDGQSNS